MGGGKDSSSAWWREGGCKSCSVRSRNLTPLMALDCSSRSQLVVARYPTDPGISDNRVSAPGMRHQTYQLLPDDKKHSNDFDLGFNCPDDPESQYEDIPYINASRATTRKREYTSDIDSNDTFNSHSDFGNHG